jgi:pyrroline-5-carboxylate reductase
MEQAVGAWPDGPLWLVGCGNMAGAMLRRWLEVGFDPARVTVITRSGKGVPSGVRSLGAPPPDETPALLLLGVKPQQLGGVAPMLAAIRPALVVSILAGVEVATLAAAVPGVPIVRAMPNLPVAIGRGVTALFTADAASEHGRLVERLMAPLGLVEWIADEAQFDAVTALAGCGPAFVFRFTEALAAAGEALGLSAGQAMRLGLATVEGAATMAAKVGDSPATLADRVASPGGSTREGLNVLDRDQGLARLLRETLTAAADRNRAMAEAAR